MSHTKHTIPLTLNASAVVGPLYKVIEECSNSIMFGLQTMELVHEIPPDLRIDEDFFRLQFGNIDEDITVNKEKFKAWLVKKGFEDLVKGIEYTLREAYIYVSIFSRLDELKTVADFNQIYLTARKQALRMHLPTMIEKIDPHLTKPLSFKGQILSINKARTCLVHRGGLVSEKDINDPVEKILKLDWVRFKLFYEKDGKEIDIIGETLIDGGKSGTQIKMRREDSTISFKLGDQITLNYKQFNEFMATCYHFGTDLVNCLPKNKKPSVNK